MFLELCLVALMGQAPQAQTPDANAPPPEPDISVEDEVLANLEHLDIGPVKVEALALPQEYLRRVADRVIQSSFEDRFRIVVADPKPDETAAGDVAASTSRKTWLMIAGAIVGALCVWIGLSPKRRRQAGAR